MPSSHVAVAIVVLAYTFKESRRFGWALLPIVVGLAIGTVWGRFHYLSDVIVGTAVGIGSVVLVNRCYSDWIAGRKEPVTYKSLGVEHVS
jgi:membrane-associated phospholipid phosphatase